MCKKEEKKSLEKVDYKILDWNNILERITCKFTDEVTGKQFYSIKKEEIENISDALKAHKSIFASIGQKNTLNSCKQLLKRLKLMRKFSIHGLNNLLIIFDDDNFWNMRANLWSIENYARLLPLSTLKKLNDTYFLFQSFYMESIDGYNILFGKPKKFYFRSYPEIYYCIDIFKETNAFENDFTVQKRLYQSLRIKSFWKKNKEYLICALLFAFIIFIIFNGSTFLLCFIPFLILAIVLLAD